MDREALAGGCKARPFNAITQQLSAPPQNSFQAIPAAFKPSLSFTVAPSRRKRQFIGREGAAVFVGYPTKFAVLKPVCKNLAFSPNCCAHDFSSFRTGAMTPDEREEMTRLCLRIQNEKDHEEFMKLVKALNDLLEKKERRLDHGMPGPGQR
jgi:hypothetical protein